MRASFKPAGHAGFTPIEAICILLLAAALVATVAFAVHTHRAKQTSIAQGQLHAIATAIDVYEVDADHLPTNLTVLGGNPPFGMPYVKPRDSLVDPWGKPYCYSVYSNRYDLRSAGPDGRLQTRDDVIFREGAPNKPSEATP